jgi:pyruvate carboxylase
MDKIQVIVKSFDNLLVKTTAKETTQNTVMHKKDGTLKTVPVRLMRKE